MTAGGRADLATQIHMLPHFAFLRRRIPIYAHSSRASKGLHRTQNEKKANISEGNLKLQKNSTGRQNIDTAFG